MVEGGGKKEMKKREQGIVERNDRGYYRCKVKDKMSFEEIKQGVFNFKWDKVITKSSIEIMVF